ncbi:MAG: hypothetical protein ACQEUK_11915 [Pseudomonadota bacterium]
MKMLKPYLMMKEDSNAALSCDYQPDVCLPEVKKKLLIASYAMWDELGKPHQFFLCYFLIVISKLAEEAGALWLACDAVRILDDLARLDANHTMRRCKKLHSSILLFCMD